MSRAAPGACVPIHSSRGQLAFALYTPLELANYLATLYQDLTSIDRGGHAVRAAIDGTRHATVVHTGAVG